MSGPPSHRLAHLSDIHFGRIAAPEVVDAIVADVNASAPTLVVASGDLTQRARTREFADARAFLARFEAPVLVVPGNHDVRAWWHNPFERVWRSAARFRRHISDDVTPSFVAEGLSVFGLNSAHGLTIKGGKIRPAHLDEMAAFFESRPAEDFRVLVLHHHLVRLRALGSHDVSRGAAHALALAREASVDLVLCGHLHRSHVAHVETLPGSGHRLVVASAGTATSNRGRGDDAGENWYNQISVGPTGFVVEERQFTDDGFRPVRTTRFDRA